MIIVFASSQVLVYVFLQYQSRILSLCTFLLNSSLIVKLLFRRTHIYYYFYFCGWENTLLLKETWPNIILSKEHTNTQQAHFLINSFLFLLEQWTTRRGEKSICPSQNLLFYLLEKLEVIFALVKVFCLNMNVDILLEKALTMIFFIKIVALT